MSIEKAYIYAGNRAGYTRSHDPTSSDFWSDKRLALRLAAVWLRGADFYGRPVNSLSQLGLEEDFKKSIIVYAAGRGIGSDLFDHAVVFVSAKSKPFMYGKAPELDVIPLSEEAGTWEIFITDAMKVHEVMTE